MYDRSMVSEFIRFARVRAGRAVVDVQPGNGIWTGLLFDVVGPEGRGYGFVQTKILM